MLLCWSSLCFLPLVGTHQIAKIQWYLFTFRVNVQSLFQIHINFDENTSHGTTWNGIVRLLFGFVFTPYCCDNAVVLESESLIG